MGGMVRWIASLPMYDEPEVRPHADALWALIAEELRAAGIGGVPAALARDVSAEESWRDPRLLLGQACGYPVVTSLRGIVCVVGSTAHDLPGCPDGEYASAVVVRDDGAITVEELRGARCAVNHPQSHSGMNALRALVAPLAHDGRFFREVRVSGRHRESLAMVRRGEADVASIDRVLYSIVTRVAPREVEGLRVLSDTACAPSLPFVTAAGNAELVPALRAALTRALADPALTDARAALHVASFLPRDEHDYAVIARMAATARAAGYPELA